MTYQQKKTMVSIVTNTLVLAVYCLYAFGRVRLGLAATQDMRFWAGTMLLFIGIGIVANIVIQILFHIALTISMSVREQIQNGECDEKKVSRFFAAETAEDEMDHLISLKSMRFGFALGGVGFVAGLVSLLLNANTAVMINVLFIAFYLGSIMEGFVQLHLYQKGVRYGKAD